MKNLVEELRWRGLISDIIPGTEEQFLKEPTTAYIGFDPTSDSLHVGSLVPIILLKHLENYGHNPIALVGGATGMIGDPSGKSEERNLLTKDVLDNNVKGIENTLNRFLRNTQLVNNYDWISQFSFIDFIRDVGKKITVNYMTSKTSVKKRLEGEGMSFTEFTYQLIQGYDFLHLNKSHNCLVQMGGSDQWGNITTGTELIRKEGREAFALTCPLITKADGTKFGKSEKGNIWLDSSKTNVYDFYQFWLNQSDEDSEKFIKIFTLLTKEEIENIINEHNLSRDKRILQRKLAEELTKFVHSESELNEVIDVSNVIYSNREFDNTLNMNMLCDIIGEVSTINLDNNTIGILELMVKSNFLASNNERRRALTEGSISVNKRKVTSEQYISIDDFVNGHLIIQRGKKKHLMIKNEKV